MGEVIWPPQFDYDPVLYREYGVKRRALWPHEVSEVWHFANEQGRSYEEMLWILWEQGCI